MVSRKINTDAIDESLLIASVGKSKIGTTTASILNGASQNQVRDTEEKEEDEKKIHVHRWISLQPHASHPRFLLKVMMLHFSNETR